VPYTRFPAGDSSHSKKARRNSEVKNQDLNLLMEHYDCEILSRRKTGFILDCM
jgi:hypothetical protein